MKTNLNEIKKTIDMLKKQIDDRKENAPTPLYIDWGDGKVELLTLLLPDEFDMYKD